MTKHICFEKTFGIVFSPLQFFDFMQHLHFSEKYQPVVGLEHQVVCKWVDYVILRLLEADQVLVDEYDGKNLRKR